LTQLQFPAGDINFETLRGQSLMFNDWICTSGNSAWTFDFTTCDWVQTTGTQNLVEVRNNHKMRQLNSKQSVLAF